MQRFNAFLVAASVSLMIIAAGLLHALKQQPPYASHVTTEKEANGVLKGEEEQSSSRGTIKLRMSPPWVQTLIDAMARSQDSGLIPSGARQKKTRRSRTPDQIQFAGFLVQVEHSYDAHRYLGARACGKFEAVFRSRYR